MCPRGQQAEGPGLFADARVQAGACRRRLRRLTPALVMMLAAAGCDESPVAPTVAAPSASRVVFVSSATFTGRFGGLPVADQACRDLAGAAGLVGIYRAWLSDDAGRSPSVTLTRSDAPFVMTSGVRVADDWADLTDGTINNPIVIDEQGNQPNGVPMVWTGTEPSGQPAESSATCRGWTDASGAVGGQIGVFDAIGPGWSAAPSAACDQLARLYCFEQ